MKTTLIFLILTIIYFVTLMIYASYPEELCSLNAVYSSSDFSNCWKATPFIIMSFVFIIFIISYIVNWVVKKKILKK